MTAGRRFGLAYVLIALAALVVAFWVQQLYPLWTHTGPAPGSGAQYVFALIPSVAFACLASLASLALMAPVLLKDTTARSLLRLLAAAVAAVLSIGLCAYWIRVGVLVL